MPAKKTSRKIVQPAPAGSYKYTLTFIIIVLSLVVFFLTIQNRRLDFALHNTNRVQENMVSQTPAESNQDVVTTPAPIEEELLDNPQDMTPGAGINDIKYYLPEGWKANTDDKSIFITPNVGGGYFSVGIYEYDPTVGRRTFYCQVTSVCMPDTVFETAKIGNINGYTAVTVDSSGSGPMYFGSKGNKFYIVEVFTPVIADEGHFEMYKDRVLDSLQF